MMSFYAISISKPYQNNVTLVYKYVKEVNIYHYTQYRHKGAKTVMYNTTCSHVKHQTFVNDHSHTLHHQA